MAALVALIMWKANGDAKKKRNAPETRSKAASGDGDRGGRAKDTVSPVKRGKAKAS